MVKTNPICEIPSPCDSLYVQNRKIGNFSLLKLHKWSPKELPTPLFSATLCSGGQILVFKIQSFSPTGSYPLCGVEQGSKLKMWSKLTKISKSSRSGPVS